jgi:hypothetical protein
MGIFGGVQGAGKMNPMSRGKAQSPDDYSGLHSETPILCGGSPLVLHIFNKCENAQINLYNPVMDKFVNLAENGFRGQFLSGEAVKAEMFHTVVTHEWRVSLHPDLYIENFTATMIPGIDVRTRIASILSLPQAEWSKLTLRQIVKLPRVKCSIPLKWGEDNITAKNSAFVNDTLIVCMVDSDDKPLKRLSIIVGDLEQSLKVVHFDPNQDVQDWQTMTIREVERAIGMYRRYL